jgi:YD repeat-containing protein
MIDNDCDGLVDCADPECQPCPRASKDPTVIRFGQGRPDMLRGHVVLHMTPVDVGSMPIGLLLSNPRDVIYRDVLPAGSLTGGRVLRYRNPDARSVGGIYSLKIVGPRTPDGTTYGVSFTAYGDLSAATDPAMRLQVYIGNAPDGRPFITTDIPWTPMPSGWRAPKDH